MTVPQALAVLRAEGVKDESIALAADVSAQQVARWRRGDAEPRLAQYLKIREQLPRFADLVDGKVAA